MISAKLQREEAIQGDSEQDTVLLRGMAIEARKFLLSFKWCPPIKAIFLGYGIGKVVAVFLVQFREFIKGKDEFLWVIVGDLPSIYLVTDNAPTAAEALAVYCDLADEWADAVLVRKNFAQAFPIRAQPTVENAASLKQRVAYLKERIIPLAKVSNGNQ
jgi:hypothetical protein